MTCYVFPPFYIQLSEFDTETELRGCFIYHDGFVKGAYRGVKKTFKTSFKKYHRRQFLTQRMQSKCFAPFVIHFVFFVLKQQLFEKRQFELN
jgi:hypothetical protein